MNLFLASYRAGDHLNQAKQFFSNGKTLVIVNAKDYKINEEKQQSISEFMQFIDQVTDDSEIIDLREFFEGNNDWTIKLKAYDAVAVAGGNTFVLARALNKSGIGNTITDLVKSGDLKYYGESAGSCITGPDITGVEHGDDPDIVPDEYSSTEFTKQGLGLIDEHIVPHYESGEWTEFSRAMEQELLKSKKPCITLTDQQVYIVEGEKNGVVL